MYLLHVSDEAWEDFIECACREREISGSKYFQVKRLGNAGDKGRDVEARLDAILSAERWDLYQGKHYGHRLTPGDAYPEMAKFFGHLLAGSYPTPRKYFFCSPRNAGPELHDLLASPADLSKKLLLAWQDGTHGLTPSKLTPQMRQLVEAFDFSKFEECLLHDLIALHALNRTAHYKLFGIEPARGADPSVPATAHVSEAVYIEELLKVYSEHTGEDVCIADLTPELVEHLESAREAFYSAEGLKRFSRDIYSDDEFSKLLAMVRTGIRPIISSPRLKSGFERHDAAIDAANNLQLTDSVLYPRLRGGDLPGSCHHLVNEKKIKWTK